MLKVWPELYPESSISFKKKRTGIPTKRVSPQNVFKNKSTKIRKYIFPKTSKIILVNFFLKTFLHVVDDFEANSNSYLDIIFTNTFLGFLYGYDPSGCEDRGQMTADVLIGGDLVNRIVNAPNMPVAV